MPNPLGCQLVSEVTIIIRKESWFLSWSVLHCSAPIFTILHSITLYYTALLCLIISAKILVGREGETVVPADRYVLIFSYQCYFLAILFLSFYIFVCAIFANILSMPGDLRLQEGSLKQCHQGSSSLRHGGSAPAQSRRRCIHCWAEQLSNFFHSVVQYKIRYCFNSDIEILNIWRYKE